MIIFKLLHFSSHFNVKFVFFVGQYCTKCVVNVWWWWVFITSEGTQKFQFILFGRRADKLTGLQRKDPFKTISHLLFVCLLYILGPCALFDKKNVYVPICANDKRYANPLSLPTKEKYFTLETKTCLWIVYFLWNKWCNIAAVDGSAQLQIQWTYIRQKPFWLTEKLLMESAQGRVCVKIIQVMPNAKQK